MNPFQPKRFTRQPQHPVRLDKTSTVRLAHNSAAPELKTNIGSRSTTPFGISLVSAVDNAFQFPRDLVLQNADVVTVQALLYAPANPTGQTKIFGTRGTASGDGNRRGWEVGFDGGSVVECNLQVMDSAGNRTSNIGTTGYSGSDITGKPIWATFQIVRTPGTSTDLTAWLKAGTLPETTTTVNVAVAFANDTSLSNFPDICGLFAGGSGVGDVQVLACFARLGLSSAASRQAFYAAPYQPFIDQPRLPWAIPSAGGSPDVTVALTGQSATASAGSLGPSSDIRLSGSAATASAGTISAALSKALTGQAATSAAGTLVAAPSIGLSGQSATASTGSVGKATAVALAGTAATTAQGTLSVAGDKTVALTGQAMTMSQGTLVASSGLVPVEACATIMRVTTTNKEVPQLISTIALRGGSIGVSVNKSTIMRALPINTIGQIRVSAINRTASLL